jgi:4-hydroxybenzoate polyprenyltransferase
VLLSGAIPTLETACLLVLGFIIFCLISSSTYIVNDLLDLESDRAHISKRRRPFASGVLSIHAGGVASLTLLLAAGLALIWTPLLFSLTAIAYLGLTLAYSVSLKRQAPFDVVALACLFTLRIFAGMAFVSEPVSPWFLTFSLFFFLGLAFVKRYAELAKAAIDGRTELVHRGYQTSDLPIVASSGAASSLGSLLVFVTYLVNEKFPQDVYSDPMWLWFIVPILLCWTLRMWFVTMRGEMHDDPIVFSLKDSTSWFFVLLSCAFIALSW